MIEPIRDPAILEGYLTDASNVRGHADGLFRPSSAAEVAQIVRWCQSTGTPLTVTAGRTSTTAGPVPSGGLLMSTERLHELIDIKPGRASAQCGIILGHFQSEIEARGWFYPPDPTSRHDCTLGASIACNASGARTFKYGATRPWIEALEVVLPTGDRLTVRRGDPIPADWPAARWHEPEVKTSAGYAGSGDLVDLFVGSEGTLGVVTSAEVRTILLPAFLGILAFFPDRDAALKFVELSRSAARADRKGALSPRCIEYLDHHCIDIARGRGIEVPADAHTVLFCEQELEACGEDAHLAAWLDALQATGALVDATLISSDPAGQQRLHALRHAVPAGINEQVVKNGMPKVGTDLSVPDAALPAMMDAYERAPLPHVLFGHIGDNHLHLNLLPKTQDELAQARAFYTELARLAVSLGGSVSGEHGIGKTKKSLLALMVDSGTLAAFRGLKSHLDPAWILGRGTMFDAPA